MRTTLIAFFASATVLLATGCPGADKDSVDIPDTGDGPADVDGDGFNVNDDCDDTEAAINPDADEICDGIDNNCDDVIDDDAIDLIEFYADGDADGFGDSATSETACEASDGFVEDATDCDDTNADVHPDADETCNEIDDNCDGTIDEDTAVDALLWYADVDLDGYGDDATETAACVAPSGMIADNTDCDDAVATSYPGADEVCNSADDNCDGVVDEDTAVDAPTWYADTDSDSYGDAAVTQVSCAAPTGYVADDADCNDGDTNINPGADELCSTAGVDDDCDSEIDEDSATDALTFYADGDGDSYGDPSNTSLSCAANSAASDTGTSAPGSAISNTLATTTDTLTLSGCGTISSLTVDVDITHTWRSDLVIDLVSPAGTTVRLWDNDGGSSENIIGNFSDAATDLTSAELLSGFSGDDGAGDWVISIEDMYGGDDGTLNSWGVNLTCSGTVADATDCDDTNADVNTAATEYCNGYDDNCDTVTDEDTAADASVWYEDSDTDGYGDPAQAPVTACYASGFYTADNDTDCNDSVATTNPGADEYCNSVDDNCDGTTDEDTAVDASTWYTDYDGDGYGDSSDAGTAQCAAPAAPISSVLTQSAADWTGADRARGNILEVTTDSVLTEFSMYLNTGDCTNVDAYVVDQADGSVVASNLGISVTSSTSGFISSGILGVSLTAGESYGLVFGWVSCDLSYYDAFESQPQPIAGVGSWIETWWDNVYSGSASLDYQGSEAKLYMMSLTVGINAVVDNTDCDDSSDSVNTAATELCNDVDDNCSGTVDDATASFVDDATSTWSSVTGLEGGTATSPAVATISEDGALYFCPGTHYVSITTEGDVDIMGATTTAADTVLDGGGVDRVLGVGTLGDVTVSDLTLQNGQTSGSGANINCAVAGSTLDLDNVVVTGGAAGTHGGGIYSQECDLELYSALVTNNTAGDKGGAVYIANADIETFETEFSGNSAVYDGGAIRVWADGGGTYYSYLEDTWVLNNTAGDEGGGVAITSSSSSSAYLDCDAGSSTSGYYGNVAGTAGGAVFLNGTSSAEADFDSDWGNCFMGDSGSANDNSPDDVYINDESTAYYMGDGSAETGREFDCDSGNGTVNGCAFFDLSTDVQNNDANFSGATGRLRGHSLQADDDYEIESFGLKLDLGSSCDLDFYILESTTGGTNNSEWTEIAYTATSPDSTSSYVYVDSGYVGDVTLVAGNYYAFLVGWNCASSTGYEWRAFSDGAAPTGLGTVLDMTVRDNTYQAGSGLAGTSIGSGNQAVYNTEINYN